MIEINLLPPEYLKRRQLQKFIILVSLGGILSLLIVGFLFAAVKTNEQVVRERLERIRTEGKERVEGLKKEVEKFKPILEQLAKLEEEKKELKKRVEVIRNLIEEQPSWARILYEVSKALPPNIWLSRLNKTEVGEKAVLMMNGYSLTQTVDIAEFMENLDRSPLFEKVSFTIISREEMEGQEVMSFEIKCALKGFKVKKKKPPEKAVGKVTPGAPPAVPPGAPLPSPYQQRR